MVGGKERAPRYSQVAGVACLTSLDNLPTLYLPPTLPLLVYSSELYVMNISYVLLCLQFVRKQFSD